MLFADVTRLLRRHLGAIRHTGIDRVNLEYARWVQRNGGKLCVKRLTGLRQLSTKSWRRILLPAQQPGESPSHSTQRGLLFFRALAPRKSVSRGSTIFVTTHSWLAHDTAWRWLASRDCRCVVFLHDLIPIQFPEYSHPREKKLHARRLHNTLKNARGILVNSQCTESALRAFAQQSALPCPPVLVNPLGHDLPESDGTMPEGLRSPYFVLLGTIEPRKNHLLILGLWRELVRRHGANTPQLVVIGHRGWECEQVVDMLERCEAIHPHLIELNDAPDEQMAGLIRGARALLMPSFAEGFGMPVQEALAWRTPVISSPLPAIKEFARDIPDYAEPHDGRRWLELIEDYMQPESKLRKAQEERLPGFRETTWPEHFDRTKEFMDALA
jgi:glycosyltransferase involved in cell wall biosynthesis